MRTSYPYIRLRRQSTCVSASIVSYTKRIQEKTIVFTHPRPLTRYSFCCGLNRALLSTEIIVLAPPPCVVMGHDFVCHAISDYEVKEDCRGICVAHVARMWGFVHIESGVDSVHLRNMCNTGVGLSSLQHSSHDTILYVHMPCILF